MTEHHNQLQSLCIAVCTEGFPDVTTDKYKEKAAVVTIEQMKCFTSTKGLNHDDSFLDES